MFFIYQILILLIIFLSPIIILIRLIKNKEHKDRFIEKFCFFKIDLVVIFYNLSRIRYLYTVLRHWDRIKRLIYYSMVFLKSHSVMIRDKLIVSVKFVWSGFIRDFLRWDMKGVGKKRRIGSKLHFLRYSQNRSSMILGWYYRRLDIKKIFWR